MLLYSSKQLRLSSPVVRRSQQVWPRNQTLVGMPSVQPLVSLTSSENCVRYFCPPHISFCICMYCSPPLPSTSFCVLLFLFLLSLCVPPAYLIDLPHLSRNSWRTHWDNLLHTLLTTLTVYILLCPTLFAFPVTLGTSSRYYMSSALCE
jgi:hypothetical protein